MNTLKADFPAEVDIHPLDEAEKALGGRPAMARALGVTPGAIGNWKVRGVPIKYCVRIEQLVPSVSRLKLRPADYLEIWPELGGQMAVEPAAEGPSPQGVQARPIPFEDRRRAHAPAPTGE